jgi:hypothetical protein
VPTIICGKYIILKDSIDLDLSSQKLAFYKIKSEREQAQSRINILNDEKKLQHQSCNKLPAKEFFLSQALSPYY